MPIHKTMKSVPTEYLAAEGLFSHDRDCLTAYQRAAVSRFIMSIQLENEAYMTRHPEISAMMELIVSYFVNHSKQKCHFLRDTAYYFLQPGDDLEESIRERLGLGPDDEFSAANDSYVVVDDELLMNDLLKIANDFNPVPQLRVDESRPISPNTMSSSFLSVWTSDTTLPTPEPIATPEKTLSEYCMINIFNFAFDKAIYSRVTDDALLYDTFYVELSKAVEAAMEVPVMLIRDDIADLLYNAYKNFEYNIIKKEERAAEIAWENRIRKKQKRTLRREANFIGYESPVSASTSTASHPSRKIPPPRPCWCHPTTRYNRYPKDRFGIYLPRQEEFSDRNVTATPAVSVESLRNSVLALDGDDILSAVSRKTQQSLKSIRSKIFPAAQDSVTPKTTPSTPKTPPTPTRKAAGITQYTN